MYIPIWIILIIIVIFVVASKRRAISQEILPTMEEMWGEGNRYKERILEKSSISGMEDAHSFDSYREIIKAAEIDLLRLRERYKYDVEKQRQIAQDWVDVGRSTEDMKTAAEIFDCDMDDGACDRFEEDIRKNFIVVVEVSERTKVILKKESQLKLVVNKLQKRAEIVSDVINKKKKKSTV